MNNVEATLVSLTVGDGADSAHVSTTGGHDDVSVLKLDERVDLAGGKVDLDGVVDLDGGIGVPDGSAVVGDKVGDSLLAELDTLDLAELVGSLLVGDSVDGESTLDVVDKSEVLAGLLELDHVHEASGEGGVGSHLAVDLDKSLHQDGVDLSTVESVLETVSQEDDQGQRLPELVGTGRRSGSVGAGQLVQHPVGGSCESLEMLLAGVSMCLFWMRGRVSVSSDWHCPSHIQNALPSLMGVLAASYDAVRGCPQTSATVVGTHGPRAIFNVSMCGGKDFGSELYFSPAGGLGVWCPKAERAVTSCDWEGVT